MKKLIPLIVAVVLFVGIGGFIYSLSAKEQLKPSETVSEFYEQAEQGNIEQAKEYLSADVIKQYETGGTWYAHTLESAIIKQGKEYSEVKPIEEEIEGNTAAVKVVVKTEGQQPSTDRCLLLKEDGKWKITFQ